MVKNIVAALLVVASVSAAGQSTAPAERFEEALDLIHAYAGSGDELDRAMEIAEELSQSHPGSGYAQVLQAEMLSTWRLRQDGRPKEVYDAVISLGEEALRFDPSLGQAHVAMARAHLRASRIDDSEAHVAKALDIDPNLAPAMFIRAEAYRRTDQPENAEIWYGRFIRSTDNPARKANGYYWIAKMYQDLAWVLPPDREALTAKAREAYEQMIAHEPTGAWRNVNFAIFLNGFAADFDAAEHYASIALTEMDFSMARFHLAAAKYQKLWRNDEGRGVAELASSVEEVATSTGVSLDEAISFRSFSHVVVDRLLELKARVRSR